MPFDIKSLAATGTVRFELTGVPINCDKNVVLISKYAGESNRPYNNARFKAFAGLAGGRNSPERLDATRRILARLVAKHVVTGWENVYEVPNEATPCTPAKVEELLLDVLNKGGEDVFDAYVAYVGDKNNFRDDVPADGLALGK